TLSDIVPRPDLARPRPEASDVLARLARDYAIVAVVSGRPAEEVRSFLGVPGVEVFGLYGLTEGGAPARPVEEARVGAEAPVPGARGVPVFGRRPGGPGRVRRARPTPQRRIDHGQGGRPVGRDTAGDDRAGRHRGGSAGWAGYVPADALIAVIPRGAGPPRP